MPPCLQYAQHLPASFAVEAAPCTSGGLCALRRRASRSEPALLRRCRRHAALKCAMCAA